MPESDYLYLFWDLVMADFRYFVMAAWIDFTLNSTLYIVVQLILVWGARKTYLE